jgi:signal transduction histidine kinase
MVGRGTITRTWTAPGRTELWMAAFVVVFVVAPYLLLILHPSADLVTAADFSSIQAYVVVLGSDALIYFYWRSIDGPTSWLIVGLTTFGVSSLAGSGLGWAASGRVDDHAEQFLLARALVAVALLLMSIAATRGRHVPVNSASLGLALGVVASVIWAVLILLPAWPEHRGVINLLRAAVLLVDILIAIAVFRLSQAARWLRTGLAVAFLMIAIGHSASYPTPHGWAASSVATVAHVLGAAILLWLSFSLAEFRVRDDRRAVRVLRRELEAAEAAGRVDHARAHEVGATLAGLVSAARLVNHTGVTAARRTELEEMIEKEMARLLHLVEGSGRSGVDEIAVDQAIRPVVVRHRANGRTIHWEEGGHRACARTDDVSEVISVLLENVFRHSRGSTAWVRSTPVGDHVEIYVGDDGDGIAEDVRSRIFEWGVSGPSSVGSGIGLPVARQLSKNLDGYLQLAETSSRGSTFVLGLPAAPR